MDVQLQELIDKIKKDGVGAAEASAQAIIEDAEKRAEAIIAEAENKALESEKKAKAESERFEKSSIDAISQAARNVLISFKDSILAQVAAIIKQDATSALSSDILKAIIPELIKRILASEDAATLSVLLSPKDLAAVQSSLISSLKAEIDKGLVLTSSDSISAGFRIGIKDGKAYYDFSPESIASLFSAYLNPRVSKILKDAAQAEAK